MGYQYGQQAKDEIIHNACFVRATALGRYGTWAAVVAALQPGTDIVAAKAPEVLDVWKGISDGSGLSYDEIRLLNLNPFDSLRRCAAPSPSGAPQPKTIRPIVGSNDDFPYLNEGMQCCVLVAFPQNGNSFITPANGGAWSAGRSMNDKGLVLMMSGGQGAQPGDFARGFPAMNGVAEVIQHCDNATQGKDMFLSLGVSGGLNDHFVDTSGHAYVVESTSTAHAVRKPGDFGEKDYLLATNMFLTKTMAPHNDPNQLQYGDLDDWYRYGTEVKLIDQSYGHLTAGSLMAILGCHNYYGARDPVTGAIDTTKPQTWHYDVLSTKPSTDEHSILGLLACAASPGARACVRGLLAGPEGLLPYDWQSRPAVL